MKLARITCKRNEIIRKCLIYTHNLGDFKQKSG